LQRGAIDDLEERGAFIQMIREDVERMEHLIVEMLELSRLESGESPPELKIVDANSLVETAIKQFSSIAIDSELKLETNLSEGLTTVLVDAEMIDHVFTNLISNAVKWSQAGDVITVNGWIHEGTVWFSVADTGLGIEPEHLPHIFERFFKTDASRAQPGTGLGLSIARHIVEAHGGVMSATSSVGEGSEFAFTVPT
jgi:signal transduction histidine kinase